MSNLEQLASLLARHNAIDEDIEALIGRPALRGHVGEWIAQEIFEVTLAESAVQKDFDGRFANGPLTGKTVNVKWYGKREGLLDINNPDGVPDYYLVMTGPRAEAMTSRWQTRPWVITEVFLFDASALVDRLRKRGVKLGVPTSVWQPEWEAARVYPEAAHARRVNGCTVLHCAPALRMTRPARGGSHQHHSWSHVFGVIQPRPSTALAQISCDP